MEAWQSTPVFTPEIPTDKGDWWTTIHKRRKESETTEATEHAVVYNLIPRRWGKRAGPLIIIIIFKYHESYCDKGVSLSEPLKESLAVMEGSRENPYEKFYATINTVVLPTPHGVRKWLESRCHCMKTNPEAVRDFLPRLITYILL